MATSWIVMHDVMLTARLAALQVRRTNCTSSSRVTSTQVATLSRIDWPSIAIPTLMSVCKEYMKASNL